MLSNRTANFKANEEEGQIKLTNNEKFVKQFTSPLPKFDIHFKFFNEEEKETSSFSFKNDLLDKKAYEFIKRKDECLAIMELDDTLPDKNEDNNSEEAEKKYKENKMGN